MLIAGHRKDGVRVGGEMAVASLLVPARALRRVKAQGVSAGASEPLEGPHIYGRDPGDDGDDGRKGPPAGAGRSDRPGACCRLGGRVSKTWLAHYVGLSGAPPHLEPLAILRIVAGGSDTVISNTRSVQE
jgi:hypothetical protein